MDVYIRVMELLNGGLVLLDSHLFVLHLCICVGVDPVICSSIYYCINLIPYEGKHTY